MVGSRVFSLESTVADYFKKVYPLGGAAVLGKSRSP